MTEIQEITENMRQREQLPGSRLSVVTVDLPRGIRARTVAYAAHHGQTIQLTICEALTAYLSGEPGEHTPITANEDDNDRWTFKIPLALRHEVGQRAFNTQIPARQVYATALDRYTKED